MLLQNIHCCFRLRLVEPGFTANINSFAANISSSRDIHSVLKYELIHGVCSGVVHEHRQEAFLNTKLAHSCSCEVKFVQECGVARLSEVAMFNLVARCGFLLPRILIKTCVCVSGDMLSESEWSSRQNSVQNTKESLPCWSLCNRQPAHPWHSGLLVSGASPSTRTWSVASIASDTSNNLCK